MKWLAALRWSVAAIAKAWFAICEKGHFRTFKAEPYAQRAVCPGKKRLPVLKASDRRQYVSLRQKREGVPTSPSPAFKKPTSRPDFLSYCYFQPKKSSVRQNFLLKTLQWFENFIYLHLVRLNVILTGPRRFHRRSPHGKNHSKNCFLVRLKTTKALPSYDAVLLVVFHVFSDRDFPTWGAPFFQQQTEAGPSRWPDGDDVQLVYSFTSQLYTCIHLFINHMQAWVQGLHAFSGQNNGITRAREAIRETWSALRQFRQAPRPRPTAPGATGCACLLAAMPHRTNAAPTTRKKGLSPNRNKPLHACGKRSSTDSLRRPEIPSEAHTSLLYSHSMVAGGLEEMS